MVSADTPTMFFGLQGWNRTGNNIFNSEFGGNVGIGTTAPLNTLHVNGSGAQGGFRVTNESGTNVFFVNSTSGNIGIGSSRISGHADFSSGISVDTAGALTIDSGTLSGGNTLWTALTIKNKGNAGPGRGVYFDTQVQSNSLTSTVGSRIGTIIESTAVNPPPTAMTFWTRTDDTTFNEKMRITSAGNVGIGTTNPTTKLEVIGTMNASIVKGGAYQSADGTTGFTGSCASTTTLTVKNGLITGCS